MITRSGYLLLMLVVSVMALAAGCGGDDDGDGGSGRAGMSQGRWGHSATLLEDGRVLVVGGQETQPVDLASAEIYDSSTETWSPAGAMKEKRGEGHTATLLNDGKVLLVGDDESVELYDPSTGIWSSTGSMANERLWHTATLLADGRVLVAGGLAGRVVLDTAEIYDPSTGEWSSAGTMSDKYSFHIAALLPDGKVILAGRFAADIYDPSSNTWSPTEESPTRERWHSPKAIVLNDGKILIPGGAWNRGNTGATWIPMPEVDMYDPATGTWSAASPMNEGRKEPVAVLLADGKVLVIGEQSAEVYDPVADTWTSAGSMKEKRIELHTATLLKDGTVLVVGGVKGATRDNQAVWIGGEGRTGMEIYDPATGW